jgi:hypothetical protein
VIKRSNIRRQGVELGSDAARPSRIRRDPVPVANPKKAVDAYPSEREAWVVVIGVVLFALAITVVTVGFSNYIN